MIHKKVQYLILVIGVVLLVFNTYRAIVEENPISPYLGIVSNIILIVAMTASIRWRNKEEKEEQLKYSQ